MIVCGARSSPIETEDVLLVTSKEEFYIPKLYCYAAVVLFNDNSYIVERENIIAIKFIEEVSCLELSFARVVNPFTSE